jgi:hypothetical protein
MAAAGPVAHVSGSLRALQLSIFINAHWQHACRNLNVHCSDVPVYPGHGLTSWA